jgi:hypothetical protein
MGTGKCHFRFVVKQDIQDIVIVHIVMKESLNSDGHNSTNINKTNNHISPKESLSSDGQQFHPYQQNKQSHFTKAKFKQ